MTKSMKRASLLVLAVCTAAVFWTLDDDTDEADAAHAEHLANRIWIERMPENSRDLVWHFVAIDHERGKFGAVGRSSNWRHFADVFKWRANGNKLVLNFPQERKRARVPVRTWECKGEAPAPFELCLKVGSGDRGHTFYSRRRWKVRPHGEALVFGIEDDMPPVGGHVLVPSVGGSGEMVLDDDGTDSETLDWLPGEALPIGE